MYCVLKKRMSLQVMRMHVKILLATLFFTVSFKTFAGDTIAYDKEGLENISNHIEILNDVNNKYSLNTIQTAPEFYRNTKESPVFSSLDVNIWSRFSIINNSAAENLYLWFEHFNLSVIKFYKVENGRLVLIYEDGNAIKPKAKNSPPQYIIHLNQAAGSGLTEYYIHIQSYHPVVLEMSIGSYKEIVGSTSKQQAILAVYFGILLSIFFYNLFLFFATADRSYLLYILYIFFLGLAQFTLAGYLFKYVWFAYPFINYYAVPVASSLAIMFGVLFSVHFLKTSHFTPFIHKILVTAILLSAVSVVASFLHFNSVSYTLVVVLQFSVGVLINIAAIIIIFKGYKPALFYAIAWAFFLSGLAIFSR